MTEDEIPKMSQGTPKKKDPKFTLRLGDTVRIKSGPFTAFTGKESIKQNLFSKSW